MMMVGGVKMVKITDAPTGQFQFMVEVIERLLGVGLKVPEGVIEIKEDMLVFHLLW
jgi:hypothetical protein